MDDAHMIKKTCTPLLANHLTKLFPTDKKPLVPLKDLSQIPFIFDTLSRKHHHHVIVYGSQSEPFNHLFLENVAHHFGDENIPKTLRDVAFYYLDIAQLLANAHDTDQIEADFIDFITTKSANHKKIILAINNIEILCDQHPETLAGNVAKHLRALLANEQWRIIAVAINPQQAAVAQHPWLKASFSTTRLSEPTTADSLAILKTFRDELENFHQVIIPDETFAYALSMANHYLSGLQTNLDKALQLLDSGAARASIAEKNETAAHKPVLTNAILANTVSSWTKIPLSHLQHNKFKAVEFIHGVQKTIFGQDAAINLIGLAMQYARIKLHIKSGPLCSLLFAGPPNVGKTETAFAIAEQLFGHKGALLRVNLDHTSIPASLTQVKVITHSDETQSPNLLEAIAQSPYAVVLLENINQAPPGTIDLFHDIFTHGYAMDGNGNKYDFRHAIVIITTTLGSERIISLTQPQPAHDSAQTLDLMQLVLNEQVQESSAPHHQANLSPQELAEEMMPALETYFSMNLLRQLNIIPFALLDYAGIEKIVRVKLKALTKQLETQFTIELTYSAEVIRFLVQETLWRGETTRPIDKTLEHHLYSCVAHELLAHMDDKNRPKRLQLQLNDVGQLLRCEFLPASDTTTLYQL
jgi:ATP-dependent Clp protease ATP-binding subunit ClpA